MSNMTKYDELLLKARAHHKASVSKIVSLFENTSPEKNTIKHYIFTKLIQTNVFAPIFGFSGPPGAGKSTFIGKLVSFFIDLPNLQLDKSKFTKNIKSPSVAIVAIDPSSPTSKGSLLADRIRMDLPITSNLFFRSQASQLESGGLSNSCFSTIRILSLLYDIVLIETVGVGQNEVEVLYCSDFLCMIMSPDSGDQLQFLKAGIMEIPDFFIIHKSDNKKESLPTYYQLEATLKLMQNNPQTSTKPPIFLASSHTKEGLEEIFQYLLMTFLKKSKSPSMLLKKFYQKQAFFLEKKIKKIYGTYGFQFFKKHKELLIQEKSYEEIYQTAEKIIKGEIKQDLNALHEDASFEM